MRRAFRLARILLLLALVAACGKGGQAGSEVGSRVTACEQAASLDKQLAADREAAQASLASPGGDATTGEQAGPDEAARRIRELNAKVADEERRLEQLRARCLGGTTP